MSTFALRKLFDKYDDDGTATSFVGLCVAFRGISLSVPRYVVNTLNKPLQVAQIAVENKNPRTHNKLDIKI